MFLPDAAAIRERAESLGLVEPGTGNITESARREAINSLLAPPADEEPKDDSVIVLSRSVVKVADGHIVVEVTHHPK